MDGGDDAALFQEVQVVDLCHKSALCQQLLAEQGRQGTLRGFCHRGGVGHHPQPLFAVELIAIEGHRTCGEEVILRYQQAAGNSHGLCTGKPCQGAAAATETMLQKTHGQSGTQGHTNGQGGAQMRRPYPQKPRHLLTRQTYHGGENGRHAQEERDEIVLYRACTVGHIPQVEKSCDHTFLAANTRLSGGDHRLRHIPQRHKAEGIPSCAAVEKATPQGERQYRCGRGCQGRNAAGHKSVVSAGGECHHCQYQRAQLVGEAPLLDLLHTEAPRGHGDESGDQQQAAPHSTAQEGEHLKEGGEIAQLLHHGQCREKHRGNKRPCGAAAQTNGGAALDPQGIVAVRLGL